MQRTRVLRKIANAASIVLTLFVAWIIICPATAHAGYLDAGSGSTLAQLIIAAIAGTKKIWSCFLGLFRRKPGGQA
jgi:hypothetical protein